MPTPPPPLGRMLGLAFALCPVLLVGCNMFDALPGVGPSRQEKRTEKHLTDARTFREQGMDDSALAALSLALQENPKLTEAHLNMGDIYRDRNEYQLASERYAAAASIEPNNFKAHYNQGLMQQLMGRTKEAVRTYLKALSIAPQNFEANRDIASAYLQQGEPQTALPYARLATKTNPESQPAWANLAAVYSLLGRYEEAIDAYRTANELGELADPVLLGLADAHIRLGNYPRAINTLNSLISTREGDASTSDSPGLGTAHERLGYALFKMRQYEDSLGHYEASLQIDTEDIAALNGAGAAYMTLYIEGARENLFQRDRAIECWRRSVQFNPDQPRIVDLLSRYSRV